MRSDFKGMKENAMLFKRNLTATSDTSLIHVSLDNLQFCGYMRFLRHRWSQNLLQVQRWKRCPSVVAN